MFPSFANERNVVFDSMIMIAFITIKSSLVPLIEGLCAQIQEIRFEMIGGLRSQLLIFFFCRIDILKEKK